MDLPINNRPKYVACVLIQLLGYFIAHNEPRAFWSQLVGGIMVFGGCYLGMTTIKWETMFK